MKPTLSLIIPCYNVEKYITAALQSVLDNLSPSKDTRVECLIVNDGATDNTAQLIENFAQNQFSTRQIAYQIITQANVGLSAARNSGMNVAQGEYWLFLDSDDVFENKALDKILAAIDAHQPDIIEFDATLFQDTGARATHTIYHDYFRQPFSLTRAFEENRWYVWSRCYHKKLFEHHRFEQGKLFEDMMTIPYLYLQAKHFFRLPESLLGYRQNSGSITANVGKRHLNDIFFAMQKAIRAEKIYPNHLLQLHILQDKTWRLLVAYSVKKFLRTHDLSFLTDIQDYRQTIRQEFQRDWGWQFSYFGKVILKRLKETFYAT
ncbi:glycosyltransferase family 2 protein [Neisseriaceae bacterium B1]